LARGVAERFIRTLKENLLWVRTFDKLDECSSQLFDGGLKTGPQYS
jgi:putative transposase